MKVVLLDRDGVINRNREDYVKNVSELEILPGVPEAIRKLNDAGFKVIVISNQQGIGKGLISPDTLDEINSRIERAVETAGGHIAAMYHCPHLQAEECDCRKPKTGMFLKASRDFTFELGDAWFIGDAPGDFQAGQRAGCKTIAVLTGKLCASDIDELYVKPQYVANDLAAAAEIVIANSR